MYLSNSSSTYYDTTGEFFVGGIVGSNSGYVSDTITNVVIHVKSKSIAESGKAVAYQNLYIGGTVAFNEGEIVKSVSEASIMVTDDRFNANGGLTYNHALVGGFVSENRGAIAECYASGTIQDEVNSFYNIPIGGFAAYNHKTIKNSYADVDMTIQSAGHDGSGIGGFVSENSGTISSCYAKGDIVTATIGSIGSFIGNALTGSSISKCFASSNITLTGSADLSKVGYFIGVANGGSSFFKNYYNSGMVVTDETNVPVTPGVTSGAEATTEVTLQSKSLLVDTLSWSEEIWTIRTGEYPCLAWELAE